MFTCKHFFLQCTMIAKILTVVTKSLPFWADSILNTRAIVTWRIVAGNKTNHHLPESPRCSRYSFHFTIVSPDTVNCTLMCWLPIVYFHLCCSAPNLFAWSCKAWNCFRFGLGRVCSNFTKSCIWAHRCTGFSWCLHDKEPVICVHPTLATRACGPMQSSHYWTQSYQ